MTAPNGEEWWTGLGEALRAYAADAGCHPVEVPREPFFAATTGWQRAKSHGTWSSVKRRALGLGLASDAPLPALPTEEEPRPRGVTTSTLVDADGVTKLQWIKERSVKESRLELLERLLRDLPDHIEPRADAAPAPAVATDADLLAVYPMGDPHLGMLSWKPETGASWDLDRSEAVHRAAFDTLVERGPRTRRAILAPLGDFFHADDSSNRTSRSGHALDVDGRYGKILATGLRLLVYAADRLLEHHDSVAVEPLTGNHDDHSALMLGVALDAYYRNEPRVQVSMSPAIHRYHRFGECLLGFTHGHTGKLAGLGGVMACDRPEDWGATRWRHWITGHRHSSQRLEVPGAIVEVFRTLAPADAWAAGEGYRSGRDQHRIVYHRRWGEVSRSLVSAAFVEGLLSESEAAA